MRRLLCAVTIGILLSVCAGVLAAEKADTSPAEQSAADTSEVSQDVDTRLAEKVTYNGGYKRLRQVVEDISAMTGVTIRCGRTDSDWQSRDIPVFVSVTDMPLGRLLNLLADCTHQGVFARHIGANEPATTRTYRIYRENRRQADLESYRKAQEDAVASTWDMLVKLANTPDLQLELKPESGQALPVLNEMMKPSRALGRVLAFLGEAGKARVLAGDVALIDGASLADTSLIRELYTSRPSMSTISASFGAGGAKVSEHKRTEATIVMGADGTKRIVEGPIMGVGPPEPKEPTDEDIWQSVVAVQLSDRSGQTNIVARAQGKNLEILSVDSMMAHMLIPACFEGFGEPAHLEMLYFWTGNEYEGGKHRYLTTEDDWTLPLLQTRVKMQLPEGRKHTYADILSALSQASGFSIVAEDFESNRHTPSVAFRERDDPPVDPRNYSIYVPTEKTIGSVLKRLLACIWAVDEDSKQIIGVARDWRQRHLNLVPHALLYDLQRKMQAGLDLEGVAPVLALTQGQVKDWITNSSSLSQLDGLRMHASLFWQVFGCLSDRERSTAMSSAGLPLAQIDSKRLAGSLRHRRRHCELRPLRLIFESESGRGYNEDSLLGILAVSDIDFISSMTMRVKPDTTTVIDAITGQTEGVGKTRYRLELTTEIDGQQIVFDAGSLSGYFPIHSSEARN